ncbi:MAG TPA: HD domain-containing phosphohydrolase [Vicinamibacterales bacterium]|jgi:putative nucleotidyltransferase with HDIG domain
MADQLTRRHALIDELVRRFAAALRGAQLYAPGHPLVVRNINAFADVVARLLTDLPAVSLALVADELVVDDLPLPDGAKILGELFERLKARGIERITVERGATPEELVAAVNGICQRLQINASDEAPWADLPHVRVGLVRVEQDVETSLADMVTIRRLYAQATTAAQAAWEAAGRDAASGCAEIQPVVRDLAQAVTQNRSALLALTAVRSADRYTFTHMVNVSVLVMAQARGLGIDGTLLREFGVAGLMHDIGKVRTPAEILTKTTALDDRELAIMRRHPIDGAEILRRSADIAPLAAIVAFEHHLRLNGTGYPEGVTRNGLNLCTMLCTIADVYDAMRSKRNYQQAYPHDRILAVLERNEGAEFEQNLVRRFVQLMGIYPVGSVVRLNTGAIGVVLKPYPPDPHRPRVRVLFAADGHRFDLAYDLDLWDVEPAPNRSSSIVGSADPPDPSFDALAAMQ